MLLCKYASFLYRTRHFMPSSMKQTVHIHDFSCFPLERTLERNETFRRIFKQILEHRDIGKNGDFYWQRHNQDGTVTPVKLSYCSSPTTLGMHTNRKETIIWKQAVIFSPMKGTGN